MVPAKYTLIEELGAGSFGEVFKIQDDDDGKIMAMKQVKLHFKGNNKVSKSIMWTLRSILQFYFSFVY